MNCSICIIIPAYNEEMAIKDTIQDYKSAFPNARILVVNNNSSDKTEEISRKELTGGMDLLLNEVRQGKGHAVKSGLSRLDADIYIMVDGDATYPAEDAKRLLNTMLNTRADMVVGDRVSSGAYDAQNSRMGHGWGNKLLTYVVSVLANQTYKDVLSGMRIMSRPFVAALDVRSSGFQLETELNIIAAYLRVHVIEESVSYQERPQDSHSKLNTLRDGMRILGFAFSNWIAFAPMQLFVIVSCFSGLVSALLGYRVIAGFLETGWPYTTTATAAAAAGLISILSLFFGISLRIWSRNVRRLEVANFLEAKRLWNSKLDARTI